MKTEWHAIVKTNDKRNAGRFFEVDRETFFDSESALDAAIQSWKARVTPRMAEEAVFEKHCFAVEA